MFKKFNTTALIILIALLGGIVLFDKLYKSKEEESTFNSSFTKIDSALVNAIYIYPKVENGQEIRLIKNGKRWELQRGTIRTYADSTAVGAILSQFADMKSISLAGQDKSNWNELQVGDTSGTKIKFVTADAKSYEFVVGKFGFNSASRNGQSYIRHADEEAVYAINGFLSFTVNQPFGSWRIKTFLQGNKNNWTSLTFTYPGDSSFLLSNSNGIWMVNGAPADSGKTAQYLSQLASMSGNGFLDSYTPASTPLYSLTINGNNQSPVTVVAYPADSTKKFVLHSSLNPDAYLDESQCRLTDRIFLGSSHFR